MNRPPFPQGRPEHEPDQGNTHSLALRRNQSVVQGGAWEIPAPVPSLVGHWVDAFKQRVRLRIDGRTARIGAEVLRAQTEHLKLMHEYHSAINGFRVADLERQVRAAELEQRMEEIAAQRRTHQRLQAVRVSTEKLALRRDRMAIRVEIARMRREMRDASAPSEPRLTPVQQRAIKKAEIEQQLQTLQVEEAKALQRAATEAEKRRLQNMYASRRDRLMEELEKHL